MSGPNSTGRDPYRRAARYYDRVIDPLNRGVRGVALRLDPPQPGWSVLDVGCGTGTGLAAYEAAGCSVFGVDRSHSMLRKAVERLGEQADLRIADGRDLPHPDGAFDRVLASMMLHEVPDGSRVDLLREASRVLKGDGQLVVTDFRFGSLRGTRGPLVKAAVWAVEAVGGHFGGFRTYRSGGGLPPLVAAAGLGVMREKIVAGGNISIHWLHSP
jgi:ubiquinone/menaquinone biosynthesis C-methylase UbiE